MTAAIMVHDYENENPNRNVILAKAGISWLWKHSLIKGYTAGAGYDDDRGAGIS